MAYEVWQRVLTDLRARTDTGSLAHAVTVAGALIRWNRVVELALAPSGDLVFTTSGTDSADRDATRVVVRRGDGSTVVDRFRSGELVEQRRAPEDEIDRILDRMLEELTASRQICRGCHEPSALSREHFELFERMHYVCFHYEFEHGDVDRDDRCEVPGCPVAALRGAAQD